MPVREPIRDGTYVVRNVSVARGIEVPALSALVRRRAEEPAYWANTTSRVFDVDSSRRRPASVSLHT